MPDKEILSETLCQPPVDSAAGAARSLPEAGVDEPHPSLPLPGSSGGAASTRLSESGSLASGAVVGGSGGQPPGAFGDAGRYELLGQIGKGGMGLVMRCRDRELKRDLAVKVLREPQRRSPEAVRRFIEEAQITGQLQHPCIVPVHEMGQFPDGRPYFTMKLVKGQTFAELLSARSTPGENLPHFLAIFQQICQPVAYAHARNVIHRDLKPANVMVGAFGEVQVMDWGLAKVLAPAATRPVPSKDLVTSSIIWTARSDSQDTDSREGSIIGTLAYMPPEQARGEVEYVDERADVFGLGAILCEILTGRPAYQGETGNEVLRKAGMAELGDALAALDRCGADPDLTRLVKDCLAPCRDDRPSHAGVVAQRLVEYLDGVQDRLRGAERERAAAEARAAAEQKARRVTVVLASSIVAILALAGGAGLWLRQEHLARHAEASRREEVLSLAVHDDLRQATELQSAGKWVQAQSALERAQGRLSGSGAETLRQRVAQLGDDLAMVVRLEQIRLEKSDPNEDGEFDYERANEGYARAFQDYGLDVLSLGAEEVAGRIKSASIKEQLGDALGDWACSVHYDEKRRERLISLARSTDTDAFRQQICNAVLRHDQAALERLTTRLEVEDLSPTGLYLLGEALDRSKTTPATLAFLRKSQQRHPADFWINLALATRLAEGDEAQVEEASRYHAITVALRPDSSVTYYNLGRILTRQSKLAEAEAVYREVVRRKPNDPLAYSRLGRVLTSRGQYGAAIAAYRRCHSLGSQDPNWSFPSERLLREAERMPELDAKLPAILRGEVQPASDEERLVLGRMCLRVKDMPMAALGFFSAALASRPALAEGAGFYRSQAANSAVRAAAGRSKDCAALETGERANLRQQALDWLRADLRLLAAQCDSSKQGDRKMALRRLKYWQTNPDLISVRDETALAKLTEMERTAWHKLWDDVASLVQRAHRQ